MKLKLKLVKITPFFTKITTFNGNFFRKFRKMKVVLYTFKIIWNYFLSFILGGSSWDASRTQRSIILLLSHFPYKRKIPKKNITKQELKLMRQCKSTYLMSQTRMNFTTVIVKEIRKKRFTLYTYVFKFQMKVFKTMRFIILKFYFIWWKPPKYILYIITFLIEFIWWLFRSPHSLVPECFRNGLLIAEIHVLKIYHAYRDQF